MSGGKTSSQEQKIKLPKEIENQAKKNLVLAEKVGSLPYAPYFGATAAAFSPTQEAAFGNTNAAANAFGLQQSSGTGLPAPTDFGGFRGYSTEGLYNDAMNRVPQDTRDMYNSFFQGFRNNGAGDANVAQRAGGNMGWDDFQRYRAAENYYAGGRPDGIFGDLVLNTPGMNSGK